MNHHEEHKGHEVKKLEALSHKVIGCAIEVHRVLGPGLLESTYQRCLSRELELNEIPHLNDASLPIDYKGIQLDCGYRVDLRVDKQMVLVPRSKATTRPDAQQTGPLKSVKNLEPIHEAQLLTYLKLSGIKVGFLMNFNTKRLKEGIKRYVS